MLVHSIELLAKSWWLSIVEVTKNQQPSNQKLMKTTLITLLAFTLCICKTTAQCTGDVVIPNATLKTVLLNNSNINSNNDDEISCEEANDYEGALNLYNLSITNLTGVEAFTNVTTLNCNGNDLTSLDVSNMSSLTVLNCNNNALTSLNIANNLALTSLNCNNNALTSLDVSNNIALTFLSCSYNDLTNLNIANGNNENITNTAITNNPYLACVQVDDATYANTNWLAFKDETAIFSEDCSASLSTANFELEQSISVYPNPAIDKVHIKVPLGESITAV